MTTEAPQVLTDPDQFEQFCARVEEQLSTQGAPDLLSFPDNGIFATGERFDQYCAEISERLRPQWEQRVALLTAATERLRRLIGVARAVQDSRLEVELCEHLAAAATQLDALNTLRGFVRPEGELAAA